MNLQASKPEESKYLRCLEYMIFFVRSQTRSTNRSLLNTILFGAILETGRSNFSSPFLNHLSGDSILFGTACLHKGDRVVF
jgi:hypothetical protein